MTSPSKNKQPLSERSSNLPSPTKSPSKIPLPPSPVAKQNNSRHEILQQNTLGPSLNQQDDKDNSLTAVPAPTLDLVQKPELARKIPEAHASGYLYVSPSDNILSPTTKKLSDVKGRRLGNLHKTSLYKAQSLFGRPKGTDANVVGDKDKS
ncbi:hypothetical protein LTS08_006208 [Lithohypha guttulata]|nr:hypothetical protein LTS08_006208 [Lithohypha guttulata]